MSDQPPVGANIFITHCRHGLDLRTNPRCYLCKPEAAVTSREAGLDAERLARALVTTTRQQAGEPDGEGWPGYVDIAGKRNTVVTLLVNELAEAIVAEYARLSDESR